MINIVCVKYGTKYDHTWVNRLYKMVKENCSLPFIFYCMTDNTDYLDPYIETIYIDHSLDLDSYWWKMCIFDNIYAFNDVPTIYFDLDTIIQKNIDYFATEIYDPKKLAIPYTEVVPWQEINDPYQKDAPTGVNSSIMIFNPRESNVIRNAFMDNMDYNILRYHGVCRYLWGTHQHLFKYMEFGKDWYMHMKRPQVHYRQTDKYKKYSVKPAGYHMPEATVAMLNGLEKQRHREMVLEFFSPYFI